MQIPCLLSSWPKINHLYILSQWLAGVGSGDACFDDFDNDSIPDALDPCPRNQDIKSTDFRKFQVVLLDPKGTTQSDPLWVIRSQGTELLQITNSDPGIALGVTNNKERCTKMRPAQSVVKTHNKKCSSGSYRIWQIQRSRLQCDVLCEHRPRWRLRRVRVLLSVQSTLLRRHVETGETWIMEVGDKCLNLFFSLAKYEKEFFHWRKELPSQARLSSGFGICRLSFTTPVLSFCFEQVSQAYWEKKPSKAFGTAGVSIKLVNSTTGPGEYLRNALWHTGNTRHQAGLFICLSINILLVLNR